MKTILMTFVLLLSFNSFASKVEVISYQLGLEDQTNMKTLCLTVIKDPQNGDLIGLVESIEDCFYARKAHKSPEHKILINFEELSQVTHPELLQHLQSLDGQLKFLFSEGE